MSMPLFLALELWQYFYTSDFIWNPQLEYLGIVPGNDMTDLI